MFILSNDVGLFKDLLSNTDCAYIPFVSRSLIVSQGVQSNLGNKAFSASASTLKDHMSLIYPTRDISSEQLNNVPPRFPSAFNSTM